MDTIEIILLCLLAIIALAVAVAAVVVAKRGRIVARGHGRPRVTIQQACILGGLGALSLFTVTITLLLSERRPSPRLAAHSQNAAIPAAAQPGAFNTDSASDHRESASDAGASDEPSTQTYIRRSAPSNADGPRLRRASLRIPKAVQSTDRGHRSNSEPAASGPAAAAGDQTTGAPHGAIEHPSKRAAAKTSTDTSEDIRQ